jgi:glycosyltransferase involved in cell wall biosynthesis
MENALPLVSIGIPTYNRPEGLKHTLDSMLAQTYPNLEIIVSDNASPNPEVEKIAREYARQDSRILYHRQTENRGVLFNYHFVLEKASGQYFMWAADDDEWENTFVEQNVSHLNYSPKICLAMCQVTYSIAETNEEIRFTQGQVFSKYKTSTWHKYKNALTQRYGELFYGIYRRDILAGVQLPTLEIVHPVLLRAMLHKDREVYVSPDFLFKKKVSNRVFLWTYLCAKNKSILSKNPAIEEKLRHRKMVRTKPLIKSLLTRSYYTTFYYRYYVLQEAGKVIKIAPISIFEKFFLWAIQFAVLFEDAFWTIAAKTIYDF